MMPKKKPSDCSSRILYLDFIKVLAAFLTVFYHFAYYRLDYGFAADSAYTPNFTRVVMCIAAACVPLFFLVNGSLILVKERSVRSLAAKVVKILLLIAVWSFAGFPSWFFKTLCALYILTPMFQFAYQKCRLLYYLMGSCVLIFPFFYNFVVLIVHASGTKAAPFCNLQRTGLFTMYSILYFLLGPLLSSRDKPISCWISGLSTGLGLLLLVAECTIYTNLNGTMFDGVNDAFPTIGALLLSVGLFTMCQRFSFDSIRKPLLWLSGQMLPIYLFHLFVIKQLAFLPFSISLGWALLLSVGIFVFCALIGACLSRIPVVCWLVKI